MAIPRQPSLGSSLRSNGNNSVTITGRSIHSPLTQLRVGVEHSKEEVLRISPTSRRPYEAAQPPPPALELNLFRRDSTYSIDSLSTLSTVSTDDTEYHVEDSDQSQSGTSTVMGSRSGSSHTLQIPLDVLRLDEELESPTTPKAIDSRTNAPEAGYFAHHQGVPSFHNPTQVYSHTQAGPSRLVPPTVKTEGLPRSTSGPELTPKRSFVVRSRPVQPGAVQSPVQQPSPVFNLSLPTRFNSNPQQQFTSSPQSVQTHVTTRPRSHSKPEYPTTIVHPALPTRAGPSHQPEQAGLSPALGDRASMHGEQGDDWGEDEDTFEWVDSYGVKQEANGNENGNINSSGVGVLRKKSLNVGRTSPTRKLVKLKAAVEASSSSSTQDIKEVGKKVRRQLTFARRAPPPPPGPPSPPLQAESSRPGLKKALSLAVHPTRINKSPKSPTAPLQPSNSQPTILPRPPNLRSESSPAHPETPQNHYQPRSASPLHHGEIYKPPNSAMSTSPKRYDLSPHGPVQTVPLKDAPLPNTRRPHTDVDGSGKGHSRASNLSFQSAAYSFYDLDGRSVNSPIPVGNSPSELAFPSGKYTKIKISSLENNGDHDRERKNSDRSMISTRTIRGEGAQSKTPEQYLNSGIEARGKGDLAKSAWYFMQAAEGGSSTGRMYWGLALRHGWGVAKDDVRALSLLRQACEESLAGTASTATPSGNGMEIQQSPGSMNLSANQKKAMTRDLSLGLFEIANCFLDGSGTKKAPDVALSYLRLAGNMGDLASQEQLGFLLSKGTSGVKKDMKEAAKWYRMAIDQGSGNTFGLAWVWKEKYME